MIWKIHIKPEEDIRREWSKGTGQHALGKRFKEDGERNHRKTEFCPPTNVDIIEIWTLFLLFNLNLIFDFI